MLVCVSFPSSMPVHSSFLNIFASVCMCVCVSALQQKKKFCMLFFVRASGLTYTSLCSFSLTGTPLWFQLVRVSVSMHVCTCCRAVHVYACADAHTHAYTCMHACIECHDEYHTYVNTPACTHNCTQGWLKALMFIHVSMHQKLKSSCILDMSYKHNAQLAPIRVIPSKASENAFLTTCLLSVWQPTIEFTCGASQQSAYIPATHMRHAPA